MMKKIVLGLGAVLIFFVLWSVYGLFIAEPVSPMLRYLIIRAVWKSMFRIASPLKRAD